MRTNTKPRPNVSATQWRNAVLARTDLNHPAPAFTGPPRTLRDHIGKREFGDFGAVLMANRPPSDDLSNRVRRWRDDEVTMRADLLLPHADQIAEDRRFNLLFVVTPLVIVIGILAGLIAAWLKGAL